jgi:hypothetical protein
VTEIMKPHHETELAAWAQKALVTRRGLTGRPSALHHTKPLSTKSRPVSQVTVHACGGVSASVRSVGVRRS